MASPTVPASVGGKKMSMEPKLRNGDYVPDRLGGVVRLQNDQALLQRVLYRLQARRGQFPLLPELGSELYRLGRESPRDRLSAARQYVVQALEPEDVTVQDVNLSDAGDGKYDLTVILLYRGRSLSITVTS